MMKSKFDSIVSDEQLETELKRTMLKRQRFAAYRRWCIGLFVLAVTLTLIVSFWLPVYYIADNSLEPVLQQGQIVFGCSIYELLPGNIASAELNGQKEFVRVIGVPGDLVDSDKQGDFTINGKKIANGNLNALPDKSSITYPYLVPENSYFVETVFQSGTDSATASFTYLDEDKITDKIVFRIWPLQTFGFME